MLTTPRFLLAVAIVLQACSGSSEPAGPDAAASIDGGIDAAVPDAGAGDADRTGDARVDASSEDARTIDRDAARGDAGPPHDAGPGPASLAAFMEEYVDAWCTLAERCSFAALWSGGSCREDLGTRFDEASIPVLIALLEDGRAAYDGPGAARCLEALAASACSMWLEATLTSCGPGSYVVGLVPDGGECATDFDCAATSHCNDATGCGNFGTCVPRPRDGEVCDSLSAPCVFPSSCGSGGVCAPLSFLREGDACTTSCGGSIGLECWSGVCRDPEDAIRGGAGDPCDPSGTPMKCEAGLVCALEPAGGYACRAGGVAIDGACAAASPSMCVAGAYCDGSVCRALPIGGESCDGPRQCASGATCVCPTGVCDTGNVCVTIGRAGESCSAPSACWSSRCEGGECLPPAEICD